MLELCTFASGSSGNCLLVSDGSTRLLVDAGISARRITAALSELDLTPADLSAILITHEHSDHVCGLATLLKKTPIPLYAAGETARALAAALPGAAPLIHILSPGSAMTFGALEVLPFATPHDAACSVGFTVAAGEKRLAVVTDLGYVPPHVLAAVSGADLALVEANYDPDWLRTGPYPAALKRRIAGDYGHLSNEDSGHLVCSLYRSGARQIILGHLSKENNSPDRALAAVTSVLEANGIRPGLDMTLDVAPPAERSRLYRV